MDAPECQDANPMNPETTMPAPIRALQVRMEVNLNRWDRHVDRCAECLRRGIELCTEGEILMDETLRVRTRLDRAREAWMTEQARASGRAPAGRPGPAFGVISGRPGGD